MKKCQSKNFMNLQNLEHYEVTLLMISKNKYC